MTFGATGCLSKAAVPTASTCYSVTWLCETSDKRAFAGRRANRDFPTEAGGPLPSARMCIRPGINHYLEPELLTQKLLLPRMDVLAAGLVPSVSCWINSNDVGQCVPSSERPTQEDTVSCQFHQCQKHDELLRISQLFFSLFGIRWNVFLFHFCGAPVITLASHLF